LAARLNVLIATSIFPNSEEVNKGIYIFHQATALSKYCNVKVVAPVPYFPGRLKSKTYGLYSRIPKRETIDGLEVMHPRVFITPKFGRYLYGLLYALSLFHIMSGLKRNFVPDVIIGYWVYPDGFANVLLAKLLKLPIILGGRGCDVNNAGEDRIKRIMVSWALRSSDRVMAVSSNMKQKMIQLGVPGEKIAVIPNGLHEIFVKHAGKKGNARSDDDKKKTILYCGRFSSEKGVEYLLKAARILKEQNVAFRLLLVGSGAQESVLKELATQYDLEGIIQFEDEIPYSNVPALMCSADIFCLPSLREGWPNVVMEALACGLPVVASRVGGVPELLVDERCGMMVAAENEEELAAALSAALKRSWDNGSISATVKERSWDKVALEMLTEIKQVVGR